MKTLGEYYDFCVLVYGKDSPSAKFFENKIVERGRRIEEGREQEVLAAASQMLMLINSMQRGAK